MTFGKIEAFGNHLRAEQNPHIAMPELFQRVVMTARGLHGVAVHPQDGDVGKERANLMLQPLGADTKNLHPRTLTLRADRRRGRFMSTTVTQRLEVLLVPREREIAIGQRNELPHPRHNINGENPRTLRNRMICPSDFTVCCIAVNNARRSPAADSESNGSLRVSTITTGGKGKRATRRGSESNAVFSTLHAQPRLQRGRRRPQ